MSQDELRFRDPAEAMGFTALPNCVLISPSLSNAGKVLYALLRLYARQSGHCFPGQERLAASLGFRTRHVRRLLDELKALGLITWERPDKNSTNRYWLERLTPCLPALAVPERTHRTGAHRSCESAHEEDSG
jgi:hypothetical protein